MRWWVSTLLGLAVWHSASAADSDELFETRIRPVLARNCYGCHTGARSGGLELDSREHLLKGGSRGPAIVPGDPGHSLLIAAVRQSDPGLKMPPGGKLKPEDIELLAEWIKAGAPWPATAKGAAPAAHKYVITAEQRAFWAFQPVRNPAPPHVKNSRWARTEIDRFILAKLEEKGLSPAPAASKRVLLRRATFDLTGLPPTPEETAAFLNDRSPRAFEKVVDRLLASPRYGERWGRYWLDVARYSDDRLNSEHDDPYPNAFRYRNWVIQAVNEDMPYDEFVESQIAGDQMPDPAKHAAGLGFYALSPEMQDDRVDATTRGFLGLTVACAQCHDHKYDPIPAQDYYSLLGIFNNTELHETPLVPQKVVEEWQARQKTIDDARKAMREFNDRQTEELSEILAARSSDYLLAAAGVLDSIAAASLDAETVKRWTDYLKQPKRNHPYLDEWDAARARQASRADLEPIAARVQQTILDINAEKKRIDDRNHIALGLDPDRETLSQANLQSLARDKWALWEDLFGGNGVLVYRNDMVTRFLSGLWKERLRDLQARLVILNQAQPPQYAFLQTIRDKAKPGEQHVYIRGDAANPGEPAPPHPLSILSAGSPQPFTKGKERIELAEFIANPDNPLTARVMVNRVWAHHFGQGIVRTPSNFGMQGDRPSHPELLDYLASRFVSEGWSLKKLHREIMLSSVYALSASGNEEADPENRMLSRANRRRLDIESLRDELLFVSGNLDGKPADGPVQFDKDNHRRTVYGFVSRRRLDAVLGLFDFPNPNNTSEQRLDTNVPLQRLFFMNSGFMMQESRAFAERVSKKSKDESDRIDEAYRLCFQRPATEEEKRLGLEFLRARKDAWPLYAQVLLSSNEFLFLN
jgi:mono/diheme cytochrome c family protein